MGEYGEELPCRPYIYLPHFAKNGSVRLQTTGFPTQPSLPPVARGARASARTHALRGREGLVCDYCVHTDTKSEQDKTNTHTAAPAGSLLHPPFSQGVMQKVHDRLQACSKSFTSCTPALSENISICGLQFYQQHT